MASDKVIPPGGEGKISVVMKTGKSYGKKSQTVTVTTNDPEHPTLSLAVSTDIVVDISLQPPQIDCGSFPRNEGVNRPAKVISNKGDSLKITKVESSNPFIVAKLVTKDDAGSLPPGETKYLIDVTVKPGMNIGMFKETVKLSTNLEKTPVYEATVSGEVVGAIHAEPRLISFRRVIGAEPQPQDQTFKVFTTDKPFTIAKIECSDINLTAKYETVEKGKSYNVTVTLAATTPEAFKQGEITLKFDSSEEPELKVLVGTTVTSPNKEQPRVGQQGNPNANPNANLNPNAGK